MNIRLKIHPGRELLVASLLVTSLLTAGCQPPAATSAPPKAKVEQKQIVEVGIVRVQKLENTVELPTTIESDETANLMPRIEAYVGAVLVDIGDPVTAGQVLIQLSADEINHRSTQATAIIQQLLADKDVLHAELGASQAQLGVIHAELDLQNSKRAQLVNLVNSGAINQQRLIEAEAAVQSTVATMTKYENAVKVSAAKLKKGESEMAVALAQLQAANAQVGYLQIKAPFDGVVSERNIDVGNLVRPAGSGDMKPLLTVVKIDKLRAIVHATTDIASQLLVGQAVQFRSDDVTNKVFEGTLSRLAGTYSRRTRMMKAEIDLDNSPDENGRRPLRAGSYGIAKIVLQSAELPVIAKSALRTRGDQTSVLVVRNNVCLVTPVTVKFMSGDKVAISQGLTGGEKVLVDPAGIQDEQVLKDVEIKTVSW